MGNGDGESYKYISHASSSSIFAGPSDYVGVLKIRTDKIPVDVSKLVAHVIEIRPSTTLRNNIDIVIEFKEVTGFEPMLGEPSA